MVGRENLRRFRTFHFWLLLHVSFLHFSDFVIFFMFFFVFSCFFFSVLFFSPFCFDFFQCFSFLVFFLFFLVRADAKTRNTSPRVLVVTMTFFLCQKFDFGALVDKEEGVRKGPFEGGSAFMFFSSFFSCFPFFVFFFFKMFLPFSFLFFLSNMFHCWH